MELQIVGPKRTESCAPWLLPSIGFELCRREVAPYITICFLCGYSITRLRLYWNEKYWHYYKGDQPMWPQDD